MSLYEKFVSQAFKDCKPIFTTIELTHKCNFSCLHCYNFDRTNPKNKITTTLDTKTIKHFLSSLKEEGGMYVNFSGGEPLLHPDLMDILDFTKKLNLIPRLKTNGFYLSQEKINTLEDLKLEGVDISLYGFSDSTYSKFTQSPNSFNKVIHNIKALKQTKIRIQINIILNSYNFHELDQMIHFCEKNDLSFNISSEISKRYDETTPLTQNVPLTEDQFKELLVGPHAQYFMTQGKVESYQCSCARSVCGLSVNADIYPCVGAPIKAGNLHNNSFKEIWHNSKELNKIRNLKNSDFKSCVTCDVKDDCTRSSGDIYVNTGEYTGCDPQALVKAKLRNQTKKNLSKTFLTS